MREYTGLPETMPGLESITTNDRNQPLSPLTHNTGNVGDSSHYWNALWVNRIIGLPLIQTLNSVGTTDDGDAYGLLTMNGDATALDKDGTAIPLWGMGSAYYRVAGVWVERGAAFTFRQWAYATEIDPYSDTAKDVWFITKNKARGANLDHTFCPSVGDYGKLGKDGYPWSEIWVGTWNYALYVDVKADTVNHLLFMTQNKAQDAIVEHVFAPYNDAHGRLGDATYKWLSAHINTVNAATLIASGLTSGRVALVTTNGQLTDDADLTFATDTLTGTKIVASTRLKIPVGTNLYG